MNYLSLTVLCALAACSSSGAESSAAPATTPAPAAAPSAEPAQPVAAPSNPPPPAPAPEPAAQPAAAEPAAEVPSAPAAAQGPCAFTPIRRFEGRVVKWEGECVNGKAEGYGALRAYPRPESGEKEIWIFFGKLKRGDPKVGAIDLQGSYMVGKLRTGEVIDSDDQNISIQGFEEATKAAKLVSERMKAAGNQASAEFYAKKAEQLELQMGE